MFDRAIPFDDPLASPEGETIEVEIIDGPVELVEEAEPSEPGLEGVAFEANLALTLPEEDLRRIGMQLKADIDADKMTRSDWEDAYRKGLVLLGLKSEEMTQPWPGACGLYHTMVAEAIVRFQSNAIMEIFPASGPAKTVIIGKITEEVEKQSRRVQDEFNYQLTEKIDDYRAETEKLLWGLGASGSAFRKIYPDPITGRPCAKYIPAEDFIINYGATSLKKSMRYTELIRMDRNELEEQQESGFYREIKVDDANLPGSSLKEKIDEINRESPPPQESGLVDLLECHCSIDVGEKVSPYIVTLTDSGEVLSIYRNWKEGDEFREKILWYVDYSYVPGMGFYGYGLPHLRIVVKSRMCRDVRLMILPFRRFRWLHIQHVHVLFNRSKRLNVIRIRNDLIRVRNAQNLQHLPMKNRKIIDIWGHRGHLQRGLILRHALRGRGRIRVADRNHVDSVIEIFPLDCTRSIYIVFVLLRRVIPDKTP